MRLSAQGNVLLALTIIMLVYSAIHFTASGIRSPLSIPGIGHVETEIPPLREHLSTGAPVHTDNPRQYGPAFFFVMHPLLRLTGDDTSSLARWLYSLQLFCLLCSFLLVCATLRRWLSRASTHDWLLTVAWLAVIWLNFAPMYAILAQKNVEMWELLYLCVALYAYLRGWFWAAAFAIAAAGLTKLIPFALMYLFLLRDRKTFAYGCAAVAALLLLGQILYGPAMGIRYLPDRFSTTMGSSTWALGWHENISLKGMIVKAVGHMAPPDPRSGEGGYDVLLTDRQKTVAVALGNLAQILGLVWLAWAILRPASPSTPPRTLWEWSLLTAVMLILSPTTAFEWSLLELGVISYAFVRLVEGGGTPVAAVMSFSAAALFLGTILPRQLLNQLTFVERINRWTGYTHLTPSEAYQYYGFPLLGLVLLTSTVWQLRPTLGVPAAPNLPGSIRRSRVQC